MAHEIRGQSQPPADFRFDWIVEIWVRREASQRDCQCNIVCFSVDLHRNLTQVLHPRMTRLA